MDNNTVVAYINNMGGIRSDLCDDIAFNIWQWPAEQQIWVSAAHIPGSENVVADKSSRTFERSSEWKLRERVFKHIFFFHLDFLSRTFTIHGTAGEGGMGGGGYLFNSSLPLPPTSQTLRH